MKGVVFRYSPPRRCEIEFRALGRTDYRVSAIGFGAWPIGGGWGRVTIDEAMATLHAAVDAGVNFFDTADVYGDGRSEQLLARLKRERTDVKIIIATKAGRRLDPHIADGYTPQNLEAFVDRSLHNLGTETLDLLQLHCPPTEVYYRPEVFAALEKLVVAGKVRYLGVSVEKVEEGLKAIEYPAIATVQIVFNMFRQRPAELLFREVKARQIGLIARVPLASGMLTGKMTRDSSFSHDDHRHFNLLGEAFDRGETFAGVDYKAGLDAVEALRSLVPEGANLAQLALRWIMMFEGVTTAIPGAKSPAQATSNAGATELPPLSEKTMKAVRDVYDSRMRDDVHHRW
jgi:aryl-alcohol dehydrogenase-like predicted oxidoreductase